MEGSESDDFHWLQGDILKMRALDIQADRKGLVARKGVWESPEGGR